MKTEKIIISSAYWGSIWRYQQLFHNNYTALQSNNRWDKKNPSNRCYIATANGIQMLSIPLQKFSDKTPLENIKISYQEDWQKKHWKSITTAYNNSPWFNYYQNEIEEFYKTPVLFLNELNLKIEEKILKLLKINDSNGFNSSFNLEEKTKKNNPSTPKYSQVFENKHGFLANLSILDLLCNEGKNAINFLL